MPLTPFATFLAGALLSLIVPAVLLLALTAWYVLFIRRVPDTPEESVTPAAEPTAPGEARGASSQ